MRRSAFHALAIVLLLGTASQAQQVVPHVTAAWGTNILTSPGAELSTSPGRSGQFGVGISVGGKVRFEPELLYTGNTYRTRMAYKVFATAVRYSFRTDLLLGFAQMNGATLRTGVFLGTVVRADANLEQADQNSFFPNQNIGRLKSEHQARGMEAGLVLGYAFPISNDGRFGMEFQLRQHVVPVVEQDQHFGLQFAQDQLIFAANTRPTVLTVGGYFKLKRRADQKG
ncbi:MAG: hypothetical protein KF905_13660 [Flavobacteriales bacterium]|nr:hypothetical protein [Flavobacteriales bacterium]